MICSQLPKGAPPKGLNVVFPARFSFREDDLLIVGGKKLDVNELLPNPNYGEDEEEWDALDEEEVEAMKEISSALNIKSLDEIEIQNYPRLVVPNLGSAKQGARVDALLKVLLPPSKVVFNKQQRDKEKAKVAAELREKRELIQKQKKEQEKLGARRMGYTY